MDYDMLARAHVWNAIEGSQDFDDKRSFRVLPVVTLKSGLQLTADGKVADRDGLNELKEYNVWKIN